jgi:hypothetical protein
MLQASLGLEHAFQDCEKQDVSTKALQGCIDVAVLKSVLQSRTGPHERHDTLAARTTKYTISCYRPLVDERFPSILLTSHRGLPMRRLGSPYL